MRTVIRTNTYELTTRNGWPAIRKLDHAGNTSRWIGLHSEIGRQVMQQLNVEPAMAPRFSAPTPKEDQE